MGHAIHSQPSSDVKRRQDKALDEALEKTFPASDPVALKQPQRGATTDTDKTAAVPKPDLPEDAMPAEKPA